jgi:WD40 repeat protein
LASGGDDDAVKLWDLETGDAIATLRGHSSGIYAIAFSPDGRFLASGNPDKTIEVWQVAD